jgi:hypothetical protein
MNGLFLLACLSTGLKDNKWHVNLFLVIYVAPCLYFGLAGDINWTIAIAAVVISLPLLILNQKIVAG